MIQLRIAARRKMEMVHLPVHSTSIEFDTFGLENYLLRAIIAIPFRLVVLSQSQTFAVKSTHNMESAPPSLASKNFH